METEKEKTRLITRRGGVIVGMNPSEDPELFVEIKKLVDEMNQS